MFNRNFHFSSLVILASLLICSCSKDEHNKNLKEISSSICKIKVNYGEKTSFGTGFLIEESTIITNYHILNRPNIDNISIEFYDDKNFEDIEKNFTFDETYDLACLKYNNTKKLAPIEISDSNVNVGDIVYSIGFQNGISLALTKGNVSNPDILVNYNNCNLSYIETNIDIYPGCSGAPLLNSKFECVGINTFGMNDKENNFIKSFGYSINSKIINNFLKNK